MRTSENRNFARFFILIVILGAAGLRFVESASPCLEYGKVFYTLAREDEKHNHWQKAERQYSKAIEFDPMLADAYSGLANVYLHDRKLDKSIESAQKAINLNPRHHQAYYTLGLAYRAKHEYAVALKSFAKAVELFPLFPDIPQYTYDLGIAYYDVGDEFNAKFCIHELRSLKQEEMAAQLENTLHLYEPWSARRGIDK